MLSVCQRYPGKSGESTRWAGLGRDVHHPDAPGFLANNEAIAAPLGTSFMYTAYVSMLMEDADAIVSAIDVKT